MKTIRYIFLLTLFIFTQSTIHAQELNVKLNINAQKVQDIDQDLVKTLEENLVQFLNENKWTNTTFRTNERIESTFTITINGFEDNKYSCDLQITCRRPVYNASYTTPTFNFKDAEITFEYNRESLEYNETNITSNLTAVMAFYAYVIIGIDFDSFAPNGGRPYFEKAMEIANAVQSLNEPGWKPFDNDRNRYSLALALTEETSSVFHSMWYKYHRLGLDEMAANADRSRLKIEETLNDLDQLYQARPSSVLLSMYGDTKLDELVNIYSKASQDEKTKAVKILQKIYPTKSSAIDKIKK